GLPKGAMLTHTNIAANISQIDQYGIGLFNFPARTIAVLPFFHIFAMTVCLNSPLANGGEVVMLPRFDLKALLALIRRKRPTILPAVPTLLQTIATSPLSKGHDLSCLEVCISGGAALPDETRAAFARVSNGILAEGYGLTECSPVVCCAGLRSPSKPMSIGMPLPGTDIRFVDLEDPTREVPLGERGELVVKGPQVMLGYYGNDAASRESFAEGWLRTGDVGYVDTDGFSFLVDRIKDIIIVNGFNVYPRTIEEALTKHPAVLECTVIGVKDDKRGEAPMAFVKLVEGQHVTEADLKSYLTADLSPIEMPREIVFRDHLPKTLIGKLSKKELKQEMQDAKARAYE
ncbi:MAG: AMP-binding protein, partial [Cucumibacter sp.]